jgi:uncharacterized protein YxeA
MKIFKIVAIILLLVIITPTIISAFSSFYTLDCEFVSCEKTTEKENEENKSEKDVDDLEEYLISKTEYITEQHSAFLAYSFRGKHFIDIVSDIVNPPPELA